MHPGQPHMCGSMRYLRQESPAPTWRDIGLLTYFASSSATVTAPVHHCGALPARSYPCAREPPRWPVTPSASSACPDRAGARGKHSQLATSTRPDPRCGQFRPPDKHPTAQRRGWCAVRTAGRRPTRPSRTCTGAPAAPRGAAGTTLVNHLSGLCMGDVPHGSIFAGTVVWQYRCNGTGAQQRY